jgi:P27 family predicted phage terminase small subunit
MGKRGFQPKKDALKVLTGQLPITKATLGTVTPVCGPCVAPAWLNEDQRAVWIRTVEDMRMCGLQVADTAILESFCCSVVQMRKVEEEIRKIEKDKSFLAAVLIKGAQSAVVVNPLMTLIRNLRTEVVTYAAQLGLTPSARARMENGALTVADKKVNLFRKLKEGRDD